MRAHREELEEVGLARAASEQYQVHVHFENRVRGALQGAAIANSTAEWVRRMPSNRGRTGSQ